MLLPILIYLHCSLERCFYLWKLFGHVELGWICHNFLHFHFYLFIYFCLLRATLAAYGSSQVNQTWSCWPTPQPQPWQIQAALATYATACGKRWIPNPLSEARDEPASSWILVRFVSAVPPQELLSPLLWSQHFSHWIVFFFFLMAVSEIN